MPAGFFRMGTWGRSLLRGIALRRMAALAAAAGCACGVAGLAVTAGSAPAASRPAGSVVLAGNRVLEMDGRWDRTSWSATTVNSGSQVFLRFTGHRIAALIGAATGGAQFYSRVDGGAPVLHTPGAAGAMAGGMYGSPDGAAYNAVNLTPRPLPDGVHTVEIDVKDVSGGGDRWSPPLRSAFVLTGFLLDRGARALQPPVPQRRMLFLGDSITEGIRAAGPQLGLAGADATEDYAWLTGRAFGADFSQVGFGGQGIFHWGNGDVPPAPVTLRYDYGGSPASPGFVPQVVVVNQGTNDRVRSSRFEPAYLRYLRRIRAAWPGAWIFALRPFNGAHAADIAAAARAVGDRHVVFVGTRGWVHRDEFTDGLHPAFAGHLNAASKLESVIARVTGWPFTPTPAAGWGLLPAGRVQAAAGGGADGIGGTGTVGTTGGTTGGTRTVDITAGQWRGKRMTFGHPVWLPAAARDVFAYVSVPGRAASSYDVLLTVSGPRTARSVLVADIPAFSGFLPWDRVHVDLGRWDGPVTGVTVEVRRATAGRGMVPFRLGDVGWTDRAGG